MAATRERGTANAATGGDERVAMRLGDICVGTEPGLTTGGGARGEEGLMPEAGGAAAADGTGSGIPFPFPLGISVAAELALVTGSGVQVDGEEGGAALAAASGVQVEADCEGTAFIGACTAPAPAPACPGSVCVVVALPIALSTEKVKISELTYCRFL